MIWPGSMSSDPSRSAMVLATRIILWNARMERFIRSIIFESASRHFSERMQYLSICLLFISAFVKMVSCAKRCFWAMRALRTRAATSALGSPRRAESMRAESTGCSHRCMSIQSMIFRGRKLLLYLLRIKS